MPYLTAVISRGKGLARTARGILTGGEILQAISSFPLGIPSHEGITHKLIDLCGVSELCVSSEEMRRIARIDIANLRLMQPTHIAFAASTDFIFGMARMYQGLTFIQGCHSRVFRSVVEAQCWLGSEAGADFEPILELEFPLGVSGDCNTTNAAWGRGLCPAASGE